MNIILIGMPGSGKTTVGELLAQTLGWQFIDSDERVEREQKMSIAEIFDRKGEPEFRKIETEMIERLCQKEDCVIATGGGAPCFERNWESFLKGGYVVWLNVSAAKLLERLEKQDTDLRPLLKKSADWAARVPELLSQRQSVYKKAHLKVETDSLSATQTAQQILLEFRQNQKKD